MLILRRSLNTGPWRAAVMVVTGLFWPTLTPAAELPPRCFQSLHIQAPAPEQTQALYILVDQTIALTEEMQRKVLRLIKDHHTPGETVKIAKFSANVKGHYTDLLFNETLDAKPSEELLYNLTYGDKNDLEQCLQNRETAFVDLLNATLSHVMANTDPKIPRTDLLYSLQNLTDAIITEDDAVAKTVLLISDGLENSEITSFYSGKTVRRILPRRELARIKRKRLVANWHKAQIYMLGLGLTADKNQYIKPRTLESLVEFWQRYFQEGSGKVKAIGTPMLLVGQL